MSGRKNVAITLGFVTAVSLISAAVAVLLLSYHYERQQFDLLYAVCDEVLEQEPEMRSMVLAALKDYTRRNADTYDISFAMAGFLGGNLLFAVTFMIRNKREAKRIQELSDFLEQVNIGKAVILSASGEDNFSKLEDEIYKTVTFLYQTKDAAVQAKNDFAENLSNIAHQLKTHITAISLSLQTLAETPSNMPLQKSQSNKKEKLGQIKKQLLRLTHLEESLLILSRLDAGTLAFQKEAVDVFTLLVLAADNLQELFAEAGISMDIPELGEMAVTADLEWTMEAVMNLMKNCMEHNIGGTIHCSYGQNPLYTEILICDEGDGFAKEDLPYLFQRFYRGKNAGPDGIGIGLALAKEILERQNGTIRARNMPGGGACFEIRMYRR